MTEIEWLNAFGDNLARLMYESRFTQKDLAEMSGLSEGTISKYLNKRQMPNVKAILNISYVLQCDVSELIDFGRAIY